MSGADEDFLPVKKLWLTLGTDIPDNNPVLRWSEDGIALIIDEEEFSKRGKHAYPGIIKSNNVASFKHRLASYGFCYRPGSSHFVPHEVELWHPFFQRHMDESMLSEVMYLGNIQPDCRGINTDDPGVMTRNKSRGSHGQPQGFDTSEGIASDGQIQVKEEPLSQQLPALEQVTEYVANELLSKETATQSQHIGSPFGKSSTVPAIGSCYSLAASLPSQINQDDVSQIQCKAEPDSSDAEDTSWNHPRKKSSDNDADAEDEKYVKRKKRNSSSPGYKKRSHSSPRRQRIYNNAGPSTSTRSSVSASPYKKNIDTFYGQKRRKNSYRIVSDHPGTAYKLWAEEDKKRMEIEKHDIKPFPSPVKETLPNYSAPPFPQCDKNCNSAQHPNAHHHSVQPAASAQYLPPQHTSRHHPQQPQQPQQPPQYSSFNVPDPSTILPPPPLMHLPNNGPSYPVFLQNSMPKVVLIPFMFSSKGYEPLIVPGGGVPSYPSSLSQLNLPDPSHCNPWAGTSHSEATMQCAQSYPPCSSAVHGSGLEDSVSSRCNRPPHTTPTTSSLQDSNDHARFMSEHHPLSASAEKKLSRRKRVRRTTYEDDTDEREELGPLQLSAPALVRSGSNHSLTDQAHMLHNVSKVTNH